MKIGNDNLGHGLVLGFTTGLLAACFDGFCMFYGDVYVPAGYPAALFIFNLSFWSLFGLCSGLALKVFGRALKQNRPANSAVSWAIAFLVPFALLYGLLGRLYLPVWAWQSWFGAAVFDHHLSFLWAAGILGLCVFLSKRASLKPAPPPLFIAEAAAIISIFQFCSNFALLNPLMADSAHSEKLGGSFLNSGLYFAGVMIIGGLYLALKRLTRKRSGQAGGGRLVLAGLFFCTVVCVSGSYLLNADNLTKPGDASARSSRGPASTKRASPVIVIVLDTVRADRMALYGGRVPLPGLEALARQAVVFENCYAPAPWTIPSHASLFTGLYPSEHGSHHDISNRAYDVFGNPLPQPLSKEFNTLAEIYSRSGFTTAALIANKIVLNPELHLNQGFEIQKTGLSIGQIYQACPFRPILHLFSYLTNCFPKCNLYYPTADDITDEGIKIIDQAGSAPLFFVLNYMDAHEPFLPRRPYHGLFVKSRFPQLYRLVQYARNFALKRISQKHWQRYQLTQYDGEIAFLDSQLGRLFDYLKDRGMYDDALIVVTADHGELFGTHGYLGHKTPIYEGTVRIPLIIKFPGNAPAGREAAHISLCDLYPTILSVSSLPVPRDISGRPYGKRPPPYVSEYYDFNLKEHRALYNGTHKYMAYSGGQQPEIYDLAQDPAEQVNLFESDAPLAEEMQRLLDQWILDHKPRYRASRPEDIKTEEMTEELRALGYIQ